MNKAVLPTVVLAPFTREEQIGFIIAETTDYASWLVERGDAPDPRMVLARARAEIEAEVEAAATAHESFWAAHDAQGATVGWLWVKPAMVGLPLEAAFLYQILVRPEMRRQGYGRAMLAALEHCLAAAGYRELRLNVWDTNVAGRGLYARAGYELVEHLPAKGQLRKHLRPPDLVAG